MTSATDRLDAATLTRGSLAAAFNQPRPAVAAGALRRAVEVAGDLSAAVGIVLCIPLVILAIGIPIALCIRLLLWLGGLL